MARGRKKNDSPLAGEQLRACAAPIPEWPSTVVAESVVPKVKDKYSCGCPVVQIGDGRIKAKCIKHGCE
jgi:hypothetical protein